MLQQRPRVKVCGLTRLQDIDSAVSAGADAIGLVFYPQSSRFVTLEQAKALRDAVPALVSVVALFVNASAADVQAVIDVVKPDLLQFHGDEPPEFCDSFNHRYLRAFRVGAPSLNTPQAVLADCIRYPNAAGWLFDSYSSGYGGSGLALDTSLLQAVQADPASRPLILAGGLNAQTVARAVQAVHPYAIDVSSGVELSGGIKSAEKINAFMAAVRSA